MTNRKGCSVCFLGFFLRKSVDSADKTSWKSVKRLHYASRGLRWRRWSQTSKMRCCDTLSDKISTDKIFVGQNFSSDKIFVTDPNFRQFCPNICLQNSISSDKIFVGQNFSTDKIFVTDPQNSSVLSDEILSDKVIVSILTYTLGGVRKKSQKRMVGIWPK